MNEDEGYTGHKEAYNMDRLKEREMLQEITGGYNIIETVKPQGTRKYNKKSKYWDTRWTKTK